MNKIKHLLILIALVALGQTAWAQQQEFDVSNELQLRTNLSSWQYNGCTFNLTNNITLNGDEFEVNFPVTINLGNYSIHGGDDSRIFNVTASGDLTLTGAGYLTHGAADNGAIIYNEGTVTIGGGLTLNFGNATKGGAIYNAGTLTLNGGNITRCNATNGGAIYNTGTLTINAGVIGTEYYPNTASNNGGAIYTAGGTININDGNIEYCTASTNGGGIHSDGGTITMTGGSISHNSATGNCGGVNLTGNTTMTMSYGSIDNNHSNANDGGVYIGSGSSLTMNSGSISGNSANYNAGVRVAGTMTMSGGSIANNTANNSSGGVHINSGSTLNMTGGSISGNTATNHGGIYVNGTLNMSGLPIVMGNLANGNTSNVYLPSGKKITVNGAFTTGANVGITCADGENTTFTSGFGTNSPNNLAVFTSDNLSYIVTVLGNEAKLVDYNAPTISDHNVPYLNVLEDGDHGTAYRELCLKMSSVSTDNPILTQDNASGGWYVLDQNCNFNKRISIQDGDTVNLIITEYLALNANKGIDVPAGATLHIWGQSDPLLPTAATGVINSFAQENGNPGIGGNGYLYIHGGVICAIGGTHAAGIKGKSVNGQGIYGLYIYGGAVISLGGEHGAGIGCGFSEVCGGIKITGGQIYAKGNYRAAGIGAGYHSWTCTPPSSFSSNPSDDEFAEIRITGGNVTAIGGTGAGIGGGQARDDWEGTPAIVYIDGGKVNASTEDGQPTNSDGAVAIGKGSRGMDIYYYLHIYDGAKVSASTSNNGGLTLQSAADGRSNDNYITFKQMLIEPCDHPNGTNYSDNGSSLNVGCNHCLAKEPYTFQSAGNWNDANHWLGNFTPGNGKNVAVKAAATIPGSCCAHVGNIDMQEGGSLTIADGGQLIHSNAGVTATVQKSINAYTVSQNHDDVLTNGWYFIASPLTDAYTPAGNMIANTYDLYRLNPTSGMWENFKNMTDHPDFTTLNNGTGYLYANSVQTTLGFTGELKPYSEANGANQVNISAGWNLVGNPFACNVCANQPFYKMNDALTGLSAELPATTAIAPCEGVIIDAASAGTVSFTQPSQASAAPSHGSLQIALSQEATRRGTAGREALMDNAIVSFDEGSQLGKFYFGEQNANIYLPQGGEEYAITYSDKQGEMPLNFKAHADGTYTISVNPENVEMSYLHLIDNMTGADVDLLTPAGNSPSERGLGGVYTFTAKTTDYESRFKLVFAANNENADDDSEAFAFFSNGDIIVNGTGTLQVIDMLGRQLSSQEIHSAFSILHSAFPSGVYVLRLINGDDVKTQKIVVK